jgi:hypothetical protein
MISRYVDVSYINWVIFSTETSQLPKLVSWTHAEKPKCHSKSLVSTATDQFQLPDKQFHRWNQKLSIAK